jgi:hypothetical protein
VAANWQWHRAHAARTGDVTVTTIDFQTASPLRAFMPSSSIGKTTSVSGEWIMDKQLLLSDRPADAHTWNGQAVSAPCAWVVRALRLADGSALAVVLGCSRSDTQVNLPTGPVNLEGVLQPSEDSDLMALSTEVPRLTTEGIVALLGLTVHDGYLVATPEHSDLSAVVPRLPGAVAVPLHWRNIVYVGNWLTFALITLAMWVRVARDEAETADANQGVMNQ